MANVEPQSDDEDWHSESRGSANRPSTTARSGRMTRSGAIWPAAMPASDAPGSACGRSSASATSIAKPGCLAAAHREHGLGIVGQHGRSPAVGADAERPIGVHRHIQAAVGLGRNRQPAGHGDDRVADLAVVTKGLGPSDRMNGETQRTRREAGSAERLDIRSEARFDHRFGRAGGRSLWRGGIVGGATAAEDRRADDGDQDDRRQHRDDEPPPARALVRRQRLNGLEVLLVHLDRSLRRARLGR